MSTLRLTQLPSQTLVKDLRDEDFTFVTAISFEERSTAWARQLWKHKATPRKVSLIDYDTVVDPEDEGKELRQNSKIEFEELCAPKADIVVLSRLNGFAVSVLSNVMYDLISEEGACPLVIDITCMTRVHILGLVTAVAGMNQIPRKLYICYATPRSYGFEKGVTLGWKDVLFIPIGKPRLFKREGHARGLVFPGHYGERLSVALQELEPASGRMLHTEAKGRPDLLLRAREANAFIAARLLALKMPRENDRLATNEGWKEEIVQLNNLESLTEIIKQQIVKASLDRGPIVLYPFGPKPLTLSAALTLASRNDVEAWAVYPVPEKFDAGYSAGVDSLIAYKIERD